jgi:hypothetical protein
MALKAEDIQKWNEVLRAFLPTAALTVDAVRGAITGLIRLVRRSEGRPEVQDGDDVLTEQLAQLVVASITKAQGPFQQVVTNADRELKD